MKSELEDLLFDTCVELGFCLKKKEYEKVVGSKYYTSISFTRDLFIFDTQEEPEKYPDLSFKVKTLFEKRFGKEVNFLNRRFLSKRASRLKRIDRPLGLF